MSNQAPSDRQITMQGLAAGLVAFEQLPPSCQPGPLMSGLRRLLATYPAKQVAFALAHAECRLAGRVETDLSRTADQHFEAHGFSKQPEGRHV